MITGVWLGRGEDISPAFEIRQEVFTKEQGFAEEADRDAFDSQAMHILMRDGEKPVATGRLYFDGAKLFIGRICVLRDYRGQAIGDLMMRMSSSRPRAFTSAMAFRCRVNPFWRRGPRMC